MQTTIRIGAALAALVGLAIASCGGPDESQPVVVTETTLRAAGRLEEAKSICKRTDAPDAGTDDAEAGGAASPPADAAARGPSLKKQNPLETPRPEGLADVETRAGRLVPVFGPMTADPSGPAKTSMPSNATGELTLEDPTSGMVVRARMRGAASAAAIAMTDGTVVYPNAAGPGSDMFLRPRREGLEDFVLLPEGSTRSELVYDVALANGVAGLRLVESILEFVDASGSPRLRVEAPEILGADCSVTRPTTTVVGCAVDTSTALPWDHPVTPPGGSTCEVRLTWNPAEVQLPALVDPTWTTTTTMPGGARGGHEAVLLANGRVLVSGNSGGGAPTTSTLVWNAGTWTSSGSMATGRYFHTLVRLKNGNVLAMGGLSPSTGAPLSSVEMWNGTSWVSRASMLYARARHRSVLLADETIVTTQNAKVLVAGSDA